MSEAGETDLYGALGGEAALRQLVARFYALMDELPEAYVIRKLHQDDLGSAREKLFEYFSGWLGGPPLYESKYGHPRMRARHMPFSIGILERDQWLACMDQAMGETGVPDDLRARLRDSFFQTADWMRNRGG